MLSHSLGKVYYARQGLSVIYGLKPTTYFSITLWNTINKCITIHDILHNDFVRLGRRNQFARESIQAMD